jgi:hypothetical protein
LTNRALRLAEATAFGGLLLYAVFAPHSIAGAWIALSISILGWLARTVITRRTGCSRRRTPLDLPLLLFYAWSTLSALVSAEPRISLLKLISVSGFFILYLVRALLRTRRATMAASVAALMIASGVAGALWSVFEVARGRGVVVEEIAPDSPFARDPALGVAVGDSVWRVNGRRVNSAAEIDEVIRDAPAGTPLGLSLFSQGEQVERVGSAVVSQDLKSGASPSGLGGTRRSHRFRASGWTRHYQTFAETLQILAQLSLGFALAYWQRRRRAHSDETTRPRRALFGMRPRLWLFAAAFLLLAAGIALTAMRTVLVAFAVGASVVAWRATRGGRARLVVASVVVVALALGAFAVWRTRAEGALRLQDESARLRLSVARVAVARIPGSATAWTPSKSTGRSGASPATSKFTRTPRPSNSPSSAACPPCSSGCGCSPSSGARRHAANGVCATRPKTSTRTASCSERPARSRASLPVHSSTTTSAMPKSHSSSGGSWERRWP